MRTEHPPLGNWGAVVERFLLSSLSGLRRNDLRTYTFFIVDTHHPMLYQNDGDLSSTDEPTGQHRYRLQYVPDRTDPDSIAGKALWAVEYNDYAPYENWEVRYTDNVLNARYFTRSAIDVLVRREGVYPQGNIRVHETKSDGSTHVVDLDDDE